MKHSIEALIDLAHRFHPRGIGPSDPAYDEQEPSRRLTAERRRAAAADAPWRAMLERLRARFPTLTIEDESRHLASGTFDACYTAKIPLPPRHTERSRELLVLVSIIAPYYVILQARSVWRAPGQPSAGTRREVTHEIEAPERAIATIIAAEIEDVFGYEPMPPEIGDSIVPDVATSVRPIGQATLYDCLFTDDR